MYKILLFSFSLLLTGGLYAGNETGLAHYMVKFPNDTTVYGCGAKAPETQPEITQFGNCSFAVGVSKQDQVFYLNASGSCYKILRRWRLIYWCDYQPYWKPTYISNPDHTDEGPTVKAWPGVESYMEYTQIIKVVDDTPPVFINCPSEQVVVCDYGANDPKQYNNGHKDLCEAPVNLSIQATDPCNPKDISFLYRLFLDLDGNGTMETIKYSANSGAWPIELTTSGNTKQAKIKFPTGFELPYGKHKVEWIATDGCGNQAVCKYELLIKDCKAPSITCGSVSVNIMQTGMITLPENYFLKYVSDNCTPTNQIKIGIRKAGKGTGFPADSHELTFDCTETGIQDIEVWALDTDGNADFCKTYVKIQDNMGMCKPKTVAFDGTVTDEQLRPLVGAAMRLESAPNSVRETATDSTGAFRFNDAPVGCGHTLTPSAESAQAAGVNTLDALLIAAHLTGKRPLATPYCQIAADADGSSSIDAADENAVNDLVLGRKASFEQANIWRFVPASHQFTDPSNPFDENWPEKLAICLEPNKKINTGFIAMKTGDANASALDKPAPASDSLRFSIADISFQAGQDVFVSLIAPSLKNTSGFQLALQLDPAFAELKKIVPGLVKDSHIAFSPESGLIAANWYDVAALDSATAAGLPQEPQPAFTLHFKAAQDGFLRNALRINRQALNAEAYTAQLQTIAATLEVLPLQSAPSLPVLYPVRPNPVYDQLTAAYFLPKGGAATLILTDATGQILAIERVNGAKGYHETQMRVNTNRHSGMLYLRLETGGAATVQQLMQE